MLTPGQADGTQRAIALLTALISDSMGDGPDIARDVFHDAVADGEAASLAIGLANVARALVFRVAVENNISALQVVADLGTGLAGMAS